MQASLTVFSANWFDCYSCARAQLTCPSCFGAPRADSGQAIKWYTAALGSNPRFERTKSNLYQFIDIGLNTTVTFNLTAPLVPATTYFVTVRGYTMPDVFTESVSNGIVGGFSVGLLAGIVTVQPYLNDLTALSARWNGFISPVPIYQYEIAISRANQQDLVFNYTSVGNLEAWSFGNLTGILLHNDSYRVCIRATDQALMQNKSCSEPLLVDLTPPCTGTVLHEHSSLSPRLTVAYESHEDEISINWSGFSDFESGLDHYSAVVLSGPTCDVLPRYQLGLLNQTGQCSGVIVNGSMLEAFSWSAIGNASMSSYVYRLTQGETLNPALRYMVLLRAYNKAGLSIVAASPIVMLDVSQPQEGVIMDGSSFRTDWVYQNSNTSIDAVWTHAFTSAQLNCPLSAEYRFASPSPVWNPATRFCRAGVCANTVPSNAALLGDDVTYDPSRVAYDQSGLSLSLVHPRAGLSYTGAIFTQLSSGLDGEYSAILQAAAGIDVINSMLWWGGSVTDLREPIASISRDPTIESTMVYPDTITYDGFGNAIVRKFSANAVGLQLRQMRNDSLSWVAIVWSSSLASPPIFTVVDLFFDASADLHTYAIQLVTGLDVGVRTRGDLLIDGQLAARFYAFPAINNALFGFNLYPTRPDTEALAVFTIAAAAIPLNDDRLCRVSLTPVFFSSFLFSMLFHFL